MPPSPWININRRSPVRARVPRTQVPRREREKERERLVSPENIHPYRPFTRRVCSVSAKIRADIHRKSERVGEAGESGCYPWRARRWHEFVLRNSLARKSPEQRSVRSLRPSARITCHADVYKLSVELGYCFFFTSLFQRVHEDLLEEESSRLCVCANCERFAFPD